MKDNKFRGRILDTKEWVYGSLIECATSGKMYIFPDGSAVVDSVRFGEEVCLNIFTFEVDPSTVGRFTGHNDQLNKEIYDGDIIKVTHKYHINCTNIGKVYFYDSQWFGAGDYLNHLMEYCTVEVVGNVYDNLELIKE